MFWIISIAAVVLDRVSKNMVEAGIELGKGFTLVPGILDFRYIRNTGAAYSILEGKTLLLMIATACMMLAIAAYYVWNRKKLSKLETAVLAMILGGGIGNFIDRAMVGYVVDFIDIHLIPVFNVADIFITCGCFLFLILTLMGKTSLSD